MPSFPYPPFASPNITYPESELLESEIGKMKNFVAWQHRMLQLEPVKRMFEVRIEAFKAAGEELSVAALINDTDGEFLE